MGTLCILVLPQFTDMSVSVPIPRLVEKCDRGEQSTCSGFDIPTTSGVKYNNFMC